ncbi:MAG: ABC transporter substrate-binding protein [bacterium]
MSVRVKTILVFLWGFYLFSAVDGAAGYPQRVISMSPNFTEIVYDIGAQNQLVGVTDFCKFPPEARKKTKVGGLFNPDFETIVSLKPDLVLLVPFYGEAIQSIKKLGIPVLVHQDSTIQDVLDTYDVLGKALGHAVEAQAAKEKLEAQIDAVRQKAEGRKKVSILFVVGHNVGQIARVYAAGENSFVGEIIALSGGDNILKGTRVAFPLVSEEQLIKRDPEVIVDCMPSDEATRDTIQKAREAWAKFSSLRAVREKRLYFLNQDAFTIPGPTMVGLAEYLSKIFAKTWKGPRSGS